MKKANYVVTDFVARNRVSLFSNMSSILFQILIPSKNAPYPNENRIILFTNYESTITRLSILRCNSIIVKKSTAKKHNK